MSQNDQPRKRFRGVITARYLSYKWDLEIVKTSHVTTATDVTQGSVSPPVIFSRSASTDSHKSIQHFFFHSNDTSVMPHQDGLPLSAECGVCFELVCRGPETDKFIKKVSSAPTTFACSK